MVLFKRTVFPWFFVMATVAVFSAGCFSKPSTDTNTASTPSVGIINMQKAVQAHPKYQQLTVLQQQFNTLAAQAQAEQAHAPQSQTEVVGQGPTPDTDALNRALEQEYNEKMQQKQKELNSQLAIKAEQVHRELTAERNSFVEQVDSEFQPQIFNIQLKLKTVQLTKEETASLQKDLEQLQAARSEKITAKDQELVSRLDAEMAPAQAALEKQLTVYSGELNTEILQKASAQSAEIAARNRDTLNSAALTPAALGGRTELEQQAVLKRQEITALQQAIVQDVRDKAAKVAAEKKLDTVLTNVRVNVTALDITDAVIDEFKK